MNEEEPGLKSRLTSRIISGLLVVALLTYPSGLIIAQDRPASARITDIKVTGLKRVGIDRVLRNIKLHKGDFVTPDAVDEDIRRLDKLGVFYPTGIIVRQESFQDGVRLIFELKERPFVTAVEVANNRVFSNNEIRDEIGMRKGMFLDFARQEESASKIRQMYVEERYMFAKVERQDKVNEVDNTVEVIYVITEGPQVTLIEVRIEGNEKLSTGQLLSQVETKTHNWWFFKRAFDEETFKLDLVRLRHFYKRHGFLNAVVSGDYEYSRDKTELVVTIKVSEGEQFTVGDVTISGHSISTGAELRKDFKLKKGDLFDAAHYQHDMKLLRDYYTSHGYLDVRIEPREIYPDKRTIDIAYNITENSRYKLGMFEIRGNTRTRDKVIRREFSLLPGDVFDLEQVDKGMTRLGYLRYFNKIEKTIAKGEEPGERDLIVEIEEGQTGNFSFGVGLSSSDGIVGTIQLTLDNFDLVNFPTSFRELFSGNAFMGGGQRLDLMYNPGTEYQQARLAFHDPYIFDTQYSFNFSVFLYDRQRDDYDEKRVGTRVGLGQKLTENLTGSLTFRFENVDITNLDLPIAPDVAAAAGDSDVLSLMLSLNYDRTDHPWQPSEGYRLMGSLEVAGDYIGSDWDFYRVDLEGRKYYTLIETRAGKKHILALRARVGVVDAYGGNSSVPIFERYYAGGLNSIRGFSYRGLGPEQLGTEVGGEFSAIGNVEYIFPIYRTIIRGEHYDMIRGVIFADGGQVAYRLADVAGTTWRTSVGVGVRLYLPALGGRPIAIDIGFPLTKDDNDEGQIFSFSMGKSF